ncbi:hypothetical protein [Sinomicrobium soli]|uniref:hypothetical protein n=1 Tax=Sinomicrobium sp. N-1-3-6 TaxID=2219864 RepID=UPI000DCF2E81|nr:hypothetical protein [Sinomicrobium sp. N-1-3-6]RAV27881.1 hypothetical protein DN748_16610 [Sinomicrobium sp. N-1-3-6]
MRGILIHIVISLVLTVAGWVVGDAFTEFSISLLDLGKANIAATSMTSRFNNRLFFGLALGAIPWIQWGINKVVKLHSLTVKTFLISTGCMLIAGLVGWQFRIFQLNKQWEAMSSLRLDDAVRPSLSYSELYFALFLFAGFCIGGVISILLLSRLKRSEETRGKASVS